MADLIGLRDIDIYVNGSSKPLSLINCFCRAIEEPETDQVNYRVLFFSFVTSFLQERADLNGYYLVEIDPQRGDKPKIVAEPRKGKRSIPFPQQHAFFHQRVNYKQFHVSQCISYSYWIKMMSLECF